MESMQTTELSACQTVFRFYRVADPYCANACYLATPVDDHNALASHLLQNQFPSLLSTLCF